MTEVPRYQIIDLVNRRNRHVQGVGDVLAMKDAARDVTFREYRCFFSEIDLFEIADEFEIRSAMRFLHAREFRRDERRDHGAVVRHLVFPPADRQVAAKRLTVIEVSADY